MSVIDASVAVKWFVDEQESDIARDLLAAGQGTLHVPDVFVVEVCAALVRHANETKADQENFREGLWRLIDLIDRQILLLDRMSPGQVAAAANLAIDLGHPLKDCIYLQLAMTMDCPLITCDARFAAKAREVWAGVRVLGAA